MQPPAQAPMHGYHFPPADPQPAYGYGNPQLLAQQQWPQHGEPQPYEVNYQGYGADQGAFQRGGQGHHQGYADTDADFHDGYYEDEEPRRGKRWLLIAVALVGAIGVGGALAYTYRSIVAPSSRLAAAKTEPAAKVKIGSVERLPAKAATEPAPPIKVTPPEPAAQEEPAPGGGDNQGTKQVKTFPVGPSGVPGIMIYKPPEAPAAPAATPKEEDKVAATPPARVAIGKPPEPPAENKDAKEEDDPPAALPPPARKVPAAVTVPRQPAPKTKDVPAAPRREAPSGALGFVAVLKSTKTHMEAMTTYADMQQKYPEVLGDQSFDVQEADLSARGLGKMYRVVVGPPGSHSWASGVCAQLKAAGYVGCWVKEY